MKIRYLIILLGCLFLQSQYIFTQTGNNSLYIPPTDCMVGSVATVPVQLSNDAEVVAIQFKLHIPDAVRLTGSGITLTDRKADHTITVKNQGGNNYLVIVFSPRNTPLRGNSGALLEIPLEIPESLELHSVHPFTFSEVALSNKTGENVMTAVNDGSIKIVPENRPDITVRDIKITSANVRPGSNISLSWVVKNIGNRPTADGWNEQVYLVGEGGDEVLLGRLNYADLIPADGSVSRQAEFKLNDYPGIDGKAYAKVKLIPNPNLGESPAGNGNNEATSGTSLTIPKLLSLKLNRNPIPEEYASDVYCFLNRSGIRKNAETFVFTNSNAKRLQIPASVTIPAGESGVSFIARVIDDTIANPDSFVIVKASGNGYPELSQDIWIEDNEMPQLTIITPTDEKKEGDTFTFTIEREWVTASPLAVKLITDHPKRFQFEQNIVIPANQKSIAVNIQAIDDDLPDVTIDAVFTVTAAGFANGTGFVKLLDNDIPDIGMEITPVSFSESAGAQAAIATLRRTKITDNRITIKLTDDSKGTLYYPSSSITLEKGVTEYQFAIGVVDNDLKDGDRKFKLTAAVYISSCSCSAAGTSAGSVSKELLITDDDGPTLKVTSSQSALIEGKTDATLLTVSRNTTSEAALTVNLSCDKPDEVTFAQTVVIPAGKTSVDIPVSAKNNSTTEGNRTITFTVAAEGFSSGVCWAMITDQTLPDAVVSEIKIQASELQAKGSVPVEITLANKGAAALPSQTKISVYLTDNPQLASATYKEPLGNLYTQNPIAPGQSETSKKTLTLPDKTGNYYIIAAVNEEQSQKELIYINNVSESLAVTMKALYRIQVSTNKTVYKPGESIIITGQAFGGNVANVPVDLYLINNGYRQTIAITTDAQGIFQYTFKPEDWQMGHFSLGACYPKEGLQEEMAGFNLYGLRKSSAGAITCEIVTNQVYKGEIVLANPGILQLSNIKAELISAPANCKVTFEPVAMIEANGTGILKYTITGSAPSEGTDWEQLKVRVSTTEGAVTELPIYYYCRSEKGELVAEIPSISTTMTIGSSRDYQLHIANTGKGETGKITVNIPGVPWMSLASPKEMASLKYGETATILLRLEPTVDLALNVPVKGTIGVNCSNGKGFSMPFNITPVSESTGTLKVDVCDEYTYNTKEAPHVANAKVRVTTPTNKLVAEGTTGKDGIFIAPSIPEGYYTIEVIAEKHSSYKNNILVDPGKETLKLVNLSIQAITITFGMEELEIEDTYEIITNVQFETNIPVPVILMNIDVPKQKTALQVGESLLMNVTLTNKGLITAQNVQLLMPQNTSPLIFEPLIEVLSELPSQSSVTIPVKVTHIAQSNLRADSETGKDFFGQCTYHMGTTYFWDCGFDKKWHKYYMPVKIWDCKEPLIPLPSIYLPTFGGGSLAGPSGTGGWFGGGGDVTIPSTPTINEDKGCIPCVVGMAVATAKCGAHFVPGAEEIAAVKEIWDSFWEELPDEIIEDLPLTDVEKDLLGDLLDKLDWGDFFAGTIDAFQNCKQAANNPDFKKVMDCLSGLDESLEDFLDKRLDKLFKIKNPHPTAADLAKFEKIKKIAKGTQKAISTALNVTQCVHDFVTACDHLLDKKVEKSVLKSSVPAYYTDFTDRMRVIHEGVDAYQEILVTVFGENVLWKECSFEDIIKIIKEMPTEEPAAELLSNNLKPKIISTEEWNIFIERWNNTVNKKINEDHIDLNQLQVLMNQISTCKEQTVKWGYNSISECIINEIMAIRAKIDQGSNSVCSSITLQFKQTMTMTRQAFRGTLSVFNGHENIAMKNVKLNLEVKDEEGNLATAHEFQINTESLDTFGGKLSGDWTLEAQKTGKVTILFIPTKYAAPTTEKRYSFGGTLSYIDPFTDLEVTKDLYPVTMTVKPSPNLDMTYFMQRDILGDDPLTVDKVEPMVPAEFSLLIHNTGTGDATNVNMVTNQPEIIDNEKGLNIRFELLSSQLNGQEQTLALGGSVATAFGTIPAGKTSYAQWWFTSTLLGHFTDYDVKATHVTSYDNPDLSLLDTVTIHELIRSIKIPKTELAGFLVNDIVDADDLPDMLYLSDGTIERVTPTKDITITPDGTYQYTLTVTPSESGWNYGKISDPTNGRQKLISIVRTSEGTTIDTRNIWQTSCTLRDGKDHLYENLIHFTDKMGTMQEQYRLTFEPGPDIILEVSSLEGIPSEEMVADKPVTEVTVRFNKVINTSTFTPDDLTLVLQGEPLDASLITIQKVNDQTFVLDLAALTKRDGYYVLTVQTAGITDAEGYNGDSGKSASWVQYLAPGSQTLTLPLSSGWNWISTNMEGLEDPVTFLAPVKEKVNRLLSQSQELTNDPKYGLTGSLKKLDSKSAYKLEINGNGSIDVKGTALDPDKVTIDLNKGWNWISYIPRSAASPTTALSLLKANVNDEVKGQRGFAKYNGTNWIGTLKQMVPGEGYLYFANTKQSFQYTKIFNVLQFPTLKSAGEHAVSWSVDMHKYPGNMSIVADLWDEKIKQEADVYTVGAFVGEECRGIGQYVDGLLFITVYGEKNGEKLTFKAIKEGLSTEWGIRETLSFGEASLGTLTEPYALHLSGFATDIETWDTSFSVYPNPVSHILYFKGNYSDIKQVAILNINGIPVIKRDLNGDNSLDVSTLSDGVYILVIQKGEKTLYRKIIKLNK